MSFANVGSFALSSGASLRIWMSYDGQDAGAQWIMADPIGPGSLMVSEATKERQIQVPDQLRTVYWTTVTNVGSDISLFSITGGGNV